MFQNTRATKGAKYKLYWISTKLRHDKYTIQTLYTNTDYTYDSTQCKLYYIPSQTTHMIAHNADLLYAITDYTHDSTQCKLYYILSQTTHHT